MSIETKYTANTGIITISTGNPNLNGTGAGIGALLTSSANGTVIKTIIIKSQESTSQGMIRFFVNNGVGDPKLILEVPVTKIAKSSRDRTFSRIIKLNFKLQSGCTLYVTTEQSEVFNIIAIGLNWDYPSPAIPNKTIYEANTGIGMINSSNPNLNGSGSLVEVLTVSGSNLGCAIRSIVVKAQQNVTPGMIRLFIDNGAGSTAYLFYEIEVPDAQFTATQKSFFFNVPCKSWLFIQSGFRILAATEISERFSIFVNGEEWNYTS